MAEFNYEMDVKINLDQLELDCQDQQEKFYKYAKEESRLRKRVDMIHEDLKVARSRIIKELLETSAKKPTGPEIEAHYRTHEDHINAKKKLIDAQYDLSLAEIAVKGFYQRRDNLANEIKLLGMNYYSKVSVTNGIRPNNSGIAINKKDVEKVIKETKKPLVDYESDQGDMEVQTNKRRRVKRTKR